MYGAANGQTKARRTASSEALLTAVLGHVLTYTTHKILSDKPHLHVQ